MKNIKLYTLILISVTLFCSCQKYREGNYPGAQVSPYISIYDLRNIYKGIAINLTEDALDGSESIRGIVTSDHSGNNIPDGLLVLQDASRLSLLRAIAVNVGDAAASYVPGDSVIVKITGGTLQRVNGLLEVTGLDGSAVTKVGADKTVTTLVASDIEALSASAEAYESALVSISRALFVPTATEGETYAGDKTINNGSGAITLHTEQDASFASTELPYSATYTGLLLRDNDDFVFWPRTEADIIVLADEPPVVAPIIITGFLADVIGTDADYEYIQLMATKDIDFSVTPMSVVTCNNAGATTPTGYPVNGWATGGTLLNGSTKTYKFNLISGTVTKGSYFYVGGNKVINGEGSTDISSANWIVSRLYASVYGDDFGSPTTNLLANSGNAAGIAVFDTIDVDSTTVPVDVIMYGGNGDLYTEGPPAAGYRITNTDYYETNNSSVSTLDPQPYFAMGTNTFRFVFPTTANTTTGVGYIAELGGTYSTATGSWSVKRTMTSVSTTATSQLSEIEGRTTIVDE
ncbi:MAG: DUF5689 domain-containing protein [Niabella sp.]